MDVHTRLEANAIVDRLVADGQTFSREDAQRLIHLIPVTRRSRFSFEGLFTSRRSGLKGHAAGVGNIALQDEPREKQIKLNVPASYRIGGYVVTHTPGQIQIELMWSETKLDRTGQSCALVYSTSTKEPKAMLISQQKTVTVLFVSFAYITYVPWKVLSTGAV